MGQFTALMYKNWLLYKRGWIGNLLEILIPVFFAAFIIVTKNLDPEKDIATQTFVGNSVYNPTIDDLTVNASYLKPCFNGVVGLAPSTDTFVQTTLNTMLTNQGKTTKLFATQSAFEEYVRALEYKDNDQICFAIIVTGTAPDYAYKLRFNISGNPANSDGPNPEDDLTIDRPIWLELFQKAVNNGVFGANTLVNTAILQTETNGSNFFQNDISPIYQDETTVNNIFTNLKDNIAILTLLPLLVIYLRQTSAMLSEKETKIRESMLIMGMSKYSYYFTWYLRYFFVYLVIGIFCSLIIRVATPRVSIMIPFVIYLLFTSCITIQNFFIMTFLTRAKLGVIISLLFFLLQFILSFISTTAQDPTYETNVALSLFPHPAFVFAFQTILYADSNLIDLSISDRLNNYAISVAILSFLINIALYLILTWYLDQVIPNEFGSKEHPCFCCVSKENRQQEFIEEPQEDQNIEGVQENFRVQEEEQKIIKIKKLRKEFNDGDRIAVEDLSLKMYTNQIFALLGHNGAGKTTTISMLTGMVDQTRGHFEVLGETQMSKIREHIGVCPQHDTLYEDLTVEEHLELYTTFKGLQGDDKNQQILKLIRDVNLMQKKDEYSKNLSGGQKRRLSVAIAFTGRSKVIILDEPTSGMDTSARRYIWQLLKNYKNDRIIILTTHFMDQADYLGDRIGIMTDGKMACCGSSIFLKNKFGAGYNITFAKQSSHVSSLPIIKLVEKHIPNSKILSDVSAELSMQLRLDQVQKFSALFGQIDQNKNALKIAEYGVSITTLEEVFLEVGFNAETQKQIKENKEDIQLKEIALRPETEGSKSKNETSGEDRMLKQSSFSKRKVMAQEKLTEQQSFNDQKYERQQSGCINFLIHFKATFLKRLRVIRRDSKGFMFELLLPLLFIILALLLMKVSFIQDQDARKVDVDLYLSQQNPVKIPIGSANTTLLDGIQTEITTRYGSKVQVDKDSTSTTAKDFDTDFLAPLKRSQETLKGGIFFTQGTGSFYEYNSLVNTKGPSSFFFIQTLASQSYINFQFTKSITITVTNHPMPRTYAQLKINNAISGINGAFVFAIAMAFKFASIISFIVKERTDRAKHQQMVSGMKLSAYWFANFVFDYALYLIIAIFAMLMILAFQITAFNQGEQFAATWLIFIFFGLAYIPFTYIFAFLFKDYGYAQAGYFFLTFAAAGMLPLFTLLLRLLGAGAVGRALAWVLRLYPAFAFGQGITNVGSVNLFKSIEDVSGSFHIDVGLGPIIYLVIEFILFFILLFVIQGIFNNEALMRCFTSQDKVTETKPIEEQDVLVQRQKALKADPQQYEILTKQLRKVFILDSQAKSKVAVDNLSFAVEKGQVFGLLGVNGAGKSTTFKMLAGQITSTSGQSFFTGLKINQNVDTIRQNLGYCPQFDALIENLTVREQLELYYDLKSLKTNNKDKNITDKIKEMNLEKYQQNISGSLSGGNKRKLSVAIAMLGNPKIVFLDEPSTGMDPKARRFMWKVISKVSSLRKQSTIILTTHSMQQAQALSSRLGIMVKGNFQCIGTPQYIKSKYGDGFQVQIKVDPFKHEDIRLIMQQKNIANKMIKESQIGGFFTSYGADPEIIGEISDVGTGSYIKKIIELNKEVASFTLTEFIEVSKQINLIFKIVQEKIGSTQIIEKLQTFIRLKIKSKIAIGKLFDFFESNKEKLSIQQYTIKQATVEQIFNRFAEKDELTEMNN